MYEGKTPGVKIGYYNPPDVARTPSQIDSVEKFVAECIPGLRDAEVVDVAAASGVDTAGIREAVDCAVAVQPVPYRTTAAAPTMETLRSADGDRAFPVALDPFTCTRFEMAWRPRTPRSCTAGPRSG